MRMNQRQVTLALLSLMAVGMLVLGLNSLAAGLQTEALLGLSAAALFGGVLGAYWRGVDWARYIAVVIFTLMVGAGMAEPFLTQYAPLAIALAPVVAFLLGDLRWVVGSGAGLYLILLARAGWGGIYSDPTTIALWALLIGGLILSRLVADTSQHDAEASAERAENALAEAEANAGELTRKAAELTRQNDEQRRLIDLVATLETPTVALAEGVILAPVIGHLDSRRAASLTERLLRDVNASRARLVVLDIAGVPAVDTGVAQALLRAIQAVRLLGCDVTVTGISASVAATMTELGINMAGVHTARTPQEALERALTAAPAARRN